MRVHDYKIVEAYNPEELRTEVKTGIKDGWQPFGGAVVSITPDKVYETRDGDRTITTSTLYTQTMVRY